MAPPACLFDAGRFIFQADACFMSPDSFSVSREFFRFLFPPFAHLSLHRMASASPLAA